MPDSSSKQRPDRRLRIFQGWMILGSAGVIFAGVDAIAVFAFGMQVRDKYGKLMDPAVITHELISLALISAGFAIAGTYLFFVMRGNRQRWVCQI
jgi:hypothetical protein